MQDTTSGVVELRDDGDQEAVPIEAAIEGPPVDPPDLPATWAMVASRPGHRRPILPASLRSRQQRRQLARWLVGYVSHTVVYHATRLPKYAAKVAVWAPVGLTRVVLWFVRWTFDREQAPLRLEAVRRNDPDAYLRLIKEHDLHVKHRGWAAAAILAGVLLVGALLLVAAPWWARWGTVAVVVVVLARVGRPADRPITDRAVVLPKFRKLTAEQVRDALSSLGIAAMRDPASVLFPQEIHRDGAGYLATVDLPRGVEAIDVIERRGRLASGLRVPLDQCWPEPVPGGHAGRLAIYVPDVPASQAKQPAWPLRTTGQVDLFRPVPFGTDARGRVVTAGMMYRNWLIGSLPGAGKSGALRLLLLAAALDPRAELRGYELKGSGDLDPLEPVCSEYGSGADDDQAAAALAMLRWARQECSRRAAAIKRLAAAGHAPENKTTPELARARSLGLHPLILFIDECQELFSHDEFGKEAGKLATQVVKLGRALGVVLLLATQRPDKESLPTGVSANVNTRFCLRVMGQTENDMILGTSMYKNGVRSTQWTDRDLGWGWLVGAGDPTACRTFWLDAEQAKRVIGRALTLRGGPVEPDQPRTRGEVYNLLDDVRAVWPEGDTSLWSELLLERLAGLRPDVYGEWDLAALNAALRSAGLNPRGVHRKIEGKGTTRAGVYWDDLGQAIEARADSRAITDSGADIAPDLPDRR